jgi:hypothetical protein
MVGGGNPRLDLRDQRHRVAAITYDYDTISFPDIRKEVTLESPIRAATD